MLIILALLLPLLGSTERGEGHVRADSSDTIPLPWRCTPSGKEIGSTVLVLY